MTRDLVIALVLCASIPARAQTFASLQGRVFDPFGALVPGAIIRVQDESSGFNVSVRTDSEARYYVFAVPNGTYTVTAEATGFRAERIDALNVDVGRTLVRDFHLAIGEIAETVIVRSETPLVDRASATVGHVVTAETVQQIPLNGRHFTDLGLLVPGSVAPSQTGFSSRPIRGVGALAFNTAGNREEAVGFVVNGVTTNNLTFGSLMFEPPLTSIEEFKVDNSVFGAEHGHVSGAVVNIVTRAGSDDFRGEAFEFFRNDALDARNFFEFTSENPHPFDRNQFGGSVGGPIVRGRTFFFGAYEGLRQRQGRRPEQPRPQRRAARVGNRPGHSAVDSADPSREFLRCERDAAIRRFGSRDRGYGSVDHRSPAQRRDQGSPPGVLREPARPIGRAWGIRQQHPGIWQRVTPVRGAS